MKYRTVRLGAVTVRFNSYWADRNGTHIQPVDKSQVDVLCIYCPDNDACYSIRPADHVGSVSLRITPSRNNQTVGVFVASKFQLMPADRFTRAES